MIKIVLCVIAVLGSVNLFGLGLIGHRVTGEIAEHYLTEDTRIAIKKILGNESFAEASTYVDDMRFNNQQEFWKVTSRPFHYVTVPDGKTYQEVGAPPQGDAVYALDKFSGVIKNPQATAAEKVIALKFIIHLVGDLHQPLHVGNGLDRGGNSVKLHFMGKPSNLHRVWDSGMIKTKRLGYLEWTHWLVREISDEELRQWSNPDPLVWVQESYDIRQTIYPGGNKIGFDYLTQNLPIIRLRIKQAGVRMAVYLNKLMSDDKN